MSDDYVQVFKQSTLYKKCLQGGLPGHGPDKNELLLRRTQGLSDHAKLVVIVANYTSRSSFTNHLLHLQGEEVFRFAKWHVDCPLSAIKDSHHPYCVNLSSPQVSIIAIKLDIMEDVQVQQPPFGYSDLLPFLSWGGLKLKENICVDGQWCIECCPPKYAIQCSALQKTTTFKCKTRMNVHKSVSGIPTPCYSGF